MTHPTAYLAEYVLGDLASQDAREVEAHLATCETCRAEVRALRDTLVTLVEKSPPATPPADAWQGIAARLSRGDDAARVVPRRNWYPSALAASLLLAFGGVLWGFQEQQDYRQLQREQRKVAGWLSRPDVAARQLTDPAGERLGSVLTLSDGRALFVLRDAPPAGSSYQAWGYGAYGGATAVDLGTTTRTLLEVPYSDYATLEISLEPERGSPQPTRALGRVPVGEEHSYD